MIHWTNDISKLVEECNNEEDIERKVKILYRINSMLPNAYQLTIPSLVTDDYINSALWRIYQRTEKYAITSSYQLQLQSCNFLQYIFICCRSRRFISPT